jgi:uncharacterized damage-inducible protein DinB
MVMSDDKQQEPWLRGTLTEVSSVQRAVLHSLQMAKEDVDRLCSGLSEDELKASPGGVASISFHLRHIPGSVDRLLAYAEGRQLTDAQVAAMKAESQPSDKSRDAMLSEFTSALDRAAIRVRALEAVDLNTPRAVGRKQLPTTVGGLLVHIAEHTQRHVGQAVTTAKLLAGNKARLIA